MDKHRGPATWASLLVAGVALEVVALRQKQHDRTLSYATRSAFCTHTTAGRVAFAAGWVAFSAWWLPHVVNGTASAWSQS